MFEYEPRITGYFNVQFVKGKMTKESVSSNQFLSDHVNEIIIDYFKKEIHITFARVNGRYIADELFKLNTGGTFNIQYAEYLPTIDNTKHPKIQRLVFCSKCKVVSYFETENISNNEPGVGNAVIKFDEWGAASQDIVEL